MGDHTGYVTNASLTMANSWPDHIFKSARPDGAAKSAVV